MNGEATEQLADVGLSADPIYLADLDRCEPAGALSSVPERGRWRTLEYEYEADALSGVMLVGGPETAAPNVTYPLGVSGWHAVSVGIYGERRTTSRVQVRLTDDETFSILTVQQTQQVQGGVIDEVFWRVADLTGRGLVLGQMSWRVAEGDGPGSHACASARIAYIKLVPLSDGQVARLQADRERADTRRLFAHNDAHSVRFIDRPTTAADIRRHVEVYRHTDVSRLYWEAGAGDLTFYFSKTARHPTHDGLEDFDRQGDRLLAESWRVFRDQGVDPFQVALDYAHELGLEFHAGYRVAGFHFPPPHNHFDHGDSFYEAHQELRGWDRDGNQTPRLAYTYPETRAKVVSLLREVAAFDVDGVCLLYNRRPPLVEYEPPLVDGFKAEYGQDPRELAETDPRWLSYRARVLTQFHREVREAMDVAAAEKGSGKRIEVSAIVMSTEQENLLCGMDLKAWVDEGLVDTLIPYSSEPNVSSIAESWADVRSLDYFVSLTKGTSCKFAPNIMPRENSAKQYRRKAAALYGAGVEHLFFWDTDVLQPRLLDVRSWNALCRLGHRDEIDAWR